MTLPLVVLGGASRLLWGLTVGGYQVPQLRWYSVQPATADCDLHDMSGVDPAMGSLDRLAGHRVGGPATPKLLVAEPPSHGASVYTENDRSPPCT